MAVETAPWAGILEGEELAHVVAEPAREARTAPFPDELAPKVRGALEAQGVHELYEHQARAWAAAQRGEHVAVVTGTASGKSLAFNLPVLDALAREPKRRALYLYPTKALAQDQLRSLTALKVPRVRPAIYDGDTEAERRWQIRKWSNLVLSNPDMLHVGVLPHHDRWGDVLSNLAYVVVDEAHVYRGVFGSHVGNVLRRLRRIARIYGAEPAVPARLGDDREPRRSSRARCSASTSPWSATTPRRARSGRSRSGTPSCSTRSSASAPARSERRRG